MMAYQNRKSVTRAPTRGNIYVTNQRVCYYESWSNYVYMDVPLSELEGYDTQHTLFVTFVQLYDRAGKCYGFSGVLAKELQKRLDQVGVARLS